MVVEVVVKREWETKGVLKRNWWVWRCGDW